MHKVKVLKKSTGDDNIVHMFNQMLGTESPDAEVILPKYTLLKGCILKLSNILKAFCVIGYKSFPDEKDGIDDIVKYTNGLDDIKYPNIDICQEYLLLKKHNSLKIAILMYKNLLVCENKLDIDDKFDDSFILRMPGFEYLPLPFSKLNIKRIWSSHTTTLNTKRYIFTVLGSLLTISKNIYELLLSPDVDVKKFSEVIVSSISKVKKQIPRCDKAFAKIEESVGMLENNFSGYYKDFIQSQNPSTIMESFIIDVSQNTKTDAQTTRQFREIISHYKKLTQGRISDPRVKQLFDLLNGSFEDDTKV